MRQLKISKSITNRESASLEKYLQEIGKEEMLTAEEEVELAQRIRNGDQKALERLTRANLRFVVSVAKQYQNQGLTLSDLINEGNLGLLKAAESVYSRPQSVLMRQGDSNSSPMPYGGSARASCRPSLNRAVSSGCRSTRSVPSIRSIARSTSLSRKTSVGLLWMRSPTTSICRRIRSTRP